MDSDSFITDYLRECRGKTEKTKKNIRSCLGLFFNWVEKEGKDEEISRKVILDYLDYLDKYKFFTNKAKTGKPRKYTPNSKYQHQSVLKGFIDWKYPEIENPIKLKVPRRKLPDSLIDEKDIEKMISVCLHPRDCALISFLYESGCRKGEMLGLTLKDVTFDDLGAIVTFPEGKTGSRRIRVIYSASYLRTWTDTHPRKDDKDSPLFCSLRTPDRVISETGLHNQLKHIAERAKINKKIYPHLLRHSRATKLAKHLKEQELKTYLGWTAGSNMAATYVHLSGEDTDPAIMRMYGIEEVKENKQGELKIFKCPRCKDLNPESAQFCVKCGLPFNVNFNELDNLDLLSNPEILQQLVEMIVSMKKSFEPGDEEKSGQS